MNVRIDPSIASLRLDKSQFFAWAASQDQRYELANGRLVLLPYATRGHARLCTNLIGSFLSRLNVADFDITQGDFAIETGEQSIRYADIMVAPFHADVCARSTTAALVLAEVLSPSTMHIDFRDKLDEYKRLSALGTYFICAQDAARIWAWTRTDGVWPDAPVILEGLDAVLDLPVLTISIPLVEIFRNFPLR